MCFGNPTQSTELKNSASQTSQSGTSSQQGTSTTGGPQWLTDAAQANVGNALNLQQGGFKPYQGEQVAPFSGEQQQSFGLGGQIAGGIAPQVGNTGDMISNYANAGPSRVSAAPIWSQMSPYMNQYVQQALTPQLRMQDIQFANQNKGVDSAATMAGAFGDTGWGQLRGTTTDAQNAARAGLIGSAYNAAFNTAIGAGAQDVSNRLNASTTNAGLRETALGRQLTGANAIASQGTNAANLLNTQGAQQTAQGQAQLNAAYNQWLLAQQYPFLTSQNANQTIGAAGGVAPRTATTANTGTTSANGVQVGTGTNIKSAPDNSGWGMLGSIAANAIPAILTGGASLPFTLGATGAMGGFNPNNGGASFIDGSSFTPAFAEGGRPPVGKPSIVGEKGPEVFVPDRPGTIVPNEVLEAARNKRADKQKPGDKKKSAQRLKFGIAA